MQSPVDSRPAAPVLLGYRPWRGQLGGPFRGTWAIARVSLLLLLRRWLFWGLYGLSVMVFLFYFYGQYLQTWIETQSGDESIRLGSGLASISVKPKDIIEPLKKGLRLDGSGYTFRNFFWFQGHIVMIVLALAGAMLIGNDFRFGSLPFYLSKPLNRWHYLGGKFLAVGVFVNLLTTVPSIILFLQYGMIGTWDYYHEQFSLLLGILGYGAVLTVTLGVTILAVSCWLRRTIPLVMAWAAPFGFFRILADFLVNGLRLDPRWRLIDLWNDTYLIGSWCLGMPRDTLRPTTQPATWEAALVLGAVCLTCLIYLNRKIRAVEVVP